MKGGYTFSLPTTSVHRLCYDAPLIWTFSFVFLLQARTVHGNDCNCSQMFSPTIGCDIVSNVNDNMGHIMHLQQFIVACDISV